MDQIRYKISWGYNDQWSTVKELIPRPQGNLPNFEYGLTTQAQNNLMNDYLNILKRTTP